MSKVFVNNVDLPLGKSISRLFASSDVGSRRPVAEMETTRVETDPCVAYQVYGTLSQPRDLFPEEYRFASRPLSKALGKSGQEALDFYSPPGLLPSWILPVDEINEWSQYDIIIYDVDKDVSSAKAALEWLSENKGQFQRPKLFVLISNLMTWAKTKPLEGKDSVLTEEEYRRRKPHPSYKDLYALEKEVIRLGKPTEQVDDTFNANESHTLNTLVICTGIVYHGYDGFIGNLFKRAWSGQELHYFKEQEGILPMIHVADLTNIILELCENVPTEQRYLIAIDGSELTAKQVVKCISDTVGNRIVSGVGKEEIFIDEDGSLTEIHLSHLEQKFECTSVRDLSLQWHCESGLLDNIQSLTKEFCACRMLRAVSLHIHGPPASGKTSLALALSSFYSVGYFHPDNIFDMFQMFMHKQEALSESLRITDYESLIEKQVEILEQMANSENKKLSPENMLWILGFLLKSNESSYRGYVVEGFDFERKDTELLFGGDTILLPKIVIELELEQQQYLSRSGFAAIGDKKGHEVQMKVWEDFVRRNSTDSVLDYFHEKEEIQTMSIDSSKFTAYEVADICKKKIGKPTNYGPSKRDILQARKEAEDKAREEQRVLEEKIRKLKEDELEKIAAQRKEWLEREASQRENELATLRKKSAPLRQFLQENILPSLVPVLVSVAKVKPDDPAAYVATALVGENTQLEAK